MNCTEAIREVFEGENRILTTTEVINRIYAQYPQRPWKKNTISAHLIGLSVNHPSSRHHPSLRKHAFLFSLGKGRYRRFDESEDAFVADEELEAETSTLETSLSLERDIENSLVKNLDQLEPGLRLYDSKGVMGRGFDTGTVGRVDILAIDSNGDYVVIEIKAGEANDKVCGQVLRYMGWVKRELAGEHGVRGIIVANDFNERLKYAAEAMPNVTLKRYEVYFKFSDVN